MNDETITTNQLHQLKNGHQILINECKYGCYANGTPSSYYINRNNILGYSLLLPLLSLPVLLVCEFFGDNFRLLLIFVWSIIPVILSTIAYTLFPMRSCIRKIPLIIPASIICLVFLLLNLYYYHPFPFIGVFAPVESGAIVLTNTILGGLLGVFIYQTSFLLFQTRKIAIICTFVILSCSSYLFWSGTAKDHILSTLLFAIILFLFISSIKTGKKTHRIIGLAFIGILTWARPEMGLGIFIAALLFQIIEWKLLENTIISLFKSLLTSFLALFAGSLPFFMNNYLATQNLLLPSFWYYLANTVPPGEPVWNTQKTAQLIPELDINMTSTSIFEGLHIFYQVIPDFSLIVFFKSLITILFTPPSGNMSIIPLTPIFLIGSIILILTLVRNRKQKKLFPDSDRIILVLLCIFGLGIFLPYLQVMDGYLSGGRPGPDIRYFISFFLVGGLIGLYPLVIWCKESLLLMIHKWYIALLIIITVSSTIFILVIEPFGGPGDDYMGYYTMCVYLLSLICAILYFSSQKRKNLLHLFTISLIMAISLPLIWQLVISYYYAIGRFNGYPYWLPFIEYLYEIYVPYSWK